MLGRALSYREKRAISANSSTLSLSNEPGFRQVDDRPPPFPVTRRKRSATEAEDVKSGNSAHLVSSQPYLKRRRSLSSTRPSSLALPLHLLPNPKSEIRTDRSYSIGMYRAVRFDVVDDLELFGQENEGGIRGGETLTVE